jgi:hypothetical protein
MDWLRAERPGAKMVALVFEVYGAVCFFSLIAFLVLAAVAKLRPDLDEEELDLVEFEKLKKLVRSEQSGDAFPVDALIIEDAPKSAPARPVKQTKRLIQRRPHLILLRKPRIT